MESLALNPHCVEESLAFRQDIAWSATDGIYRIFEEGELPYDFGPVSASMSRAWEALSGGGVTHKALIALAGENDEFCRSAFPKFLKAFGDREFLRRTISFEGAPLPPIVPACPFFSQTVFDASAT